MPNSIRYNSIYKHNHNKYLMLEYIISHNFIYKHNNKKRLLIIVPMIKFHYNAFIIFNRLKHLIIFD